MTKQEEICPICGEGHLEHRVEKNSVEYNGQTALLDSQYSVCDLCGSEQASHNQTRNNKRAMVAFKKQVDGLLMGSELRALRLRLRITQRQAAAIFGGGPVAFSKYESDDVMQSEAMDKLLRLADKFPEALNYLAQKANVEIHQFQPIAFFDSASYVRSNQPIIEVETSEFKRPHLRLIHSAKSVKQTTPESGKWISVDPPRHAAC